MFRLTSFLLLLQLLGTCSLFSQTLEKDPQPLTIEECANISLKQNLTLLAKKYDVDIAKADEIQAGLYRNPSFSALSSLNPFGKNYNQSSTGGPRQLDLLLNVPLDLSSKIKSGKRKAQTWTYISEVMLEAAFREVAYQTRVAYLELVLKENVLQLLRDREINLQRLAKTIQNRIGGSGIQPLLLTRAQLAVESASIDTQVAVVDVETARRALALLLGKEGSPDLVPLTKLRDVQLEDPPKYDEIIETVKEDYPNLQALRLAVDFSENQITAAQAQVWDDFTLFGGVSRQSGVDAYPKALPNSGYPMETGIPGQSSWALGVIIPLPSLNRNQGNIRKARVIKEQATVYYRAAEITLEKEVKTLIQGMLLNKNIIQQIESSQLPKAQKVLNNQQRLFGTGGANLLEYFDAVNAYNGTLMTYYKAVADYRKNRAKLESYLNKGIRP
ncbi:hypothetical protein CH373_07165 [Leptospira perolatii]|uniref:Channel protein TolC n=1 Tax=Leptospira perolatii TaxID=2023191 RepID=A0A2M9ZPA1_9LEPT|nr:TolC family protein [Leptospira perolatii]PJZ70702.1 hypothetical protein CH360_04025 [Leptospira perolatii]PJZ73912.1 hypothetical protein CH373_07165 [Leptospira perolatii]